MAPRAEGMQTPTPYTSYAILVGGGEKFANQNIEARVLKQEKRNRRQNPWLLDLAPYCDRRQLIQGFVSTRTECVLFMFSEIVGTVDPRVTFWFFFFFVCLVCSHAPVISQSVAIIPSKMLDNGRHWINSSHIDLKTCVTQFCVCVWMSVLRVILMDSLSKKYSKHSYWSRRLSVGTWAMLNECFGVLVGKEKLVRVYAWHRGAQLNKTKASFFCNSLKIRRGDVDGLSGYRRQDQKIRPLEDKDQQLFTWDEVSLTIVRSNG